MPFEKNHKHRILPAGSVSLDKQPISFKGRLGQREKLKSVPNWQERLRNFVDELITDAGIND